MLDAALGHAGPETETESERAIRLGEMTPFGTAMSFRESPTKPKKVPLQPKPTVKLGASDFDKYLMDQANKAKVKKKQMKKTVSAPEVGTKSVSVSKESVEYFSETLMKQEIIRRTYHSHHYGAKREHAGGKLCENAEPCTLDRRRDIGTSTTFDGRCEQRIH